MSGYRPLRKYRGRQLDACGTYDMQIKLRWNDYTCYRCFSRYVVERGVRKSRVKQYRTPLDRIHAYMIGCRVFMYRCMCMHACLHELIYVCRPEGYRCVCVCVQYAKWRCVLAHTVCVKGLRMCVYAIWKRLIAVLWYVNRSAAYDTLNHQWFPVKVLETSDDLQVHRMNIKQLDINAMWMQCLYTQTAPMLPSLSVAACIIQGCVKRRGLPYRTSPHCHCAPRYRYNI